MLISHYKFLIFLLFIGIGLILQSLGFNLSRLPGDLGDARFNNYILEHFFQWLSHPGTNFWDAPFFYPYPLTTAFSDSLLGSAPFYAIFRFLGFSRETAFQGWYVIGYILNYLAAVFVLLKLELKPIAATCAAFFFAFGLPIFSQEHHSQLFYRFCVPVAVYCLWHFAHHPRLRTFFFLILAAVFQFFLTFYIGYFLVLLLLVMGILLPLFSQSAIKANIIKFWGTVFKTAWTESENRERILSFIGIFAAIICLTSIIYPYIQVTQIYKFSRSSQEILSMLPRIQSYLLTDHSQIWPSNSPIFSSIPIRYEHQLFPGISVILLTLIGLLWRFPSKTHKFSFLNILSAFILIVFTLSINDFSFYKLVINLPGFNSIRAVTRIQLVLMWPIAVFCGHVLDAMLRKQNSGFILKLSVFFLISLLIIESTFCNHDTFSKEEAQARIISLKEQVEHTITDNNENPILFLGTNVEEGWYLTELDAMLVAQELGIPTMNGFSGNLLNGFGWHTECAEIPNWIIGYMKFNQITDEREYFNLINRAVPVRLNNCQPTWLTQLPAPLQP